MSKITVLNNGPVLVDDVTEVVDAATGAKIPIEKSTVALCRCGQSANKPFCDGAHKAAGFDGTCARQTAG